MGLRSQLDEALATLLSEAAEFSSADLATRLGTTRQAVHRHLSRWLAEGRLLRTGAGRATRYHSASPTPGFHATYPLAGLEEHRVWEALSRTRAPDAWSEPAAEILQYALTELVNNAIDHSGADQVSVQLDIDPATVRLIISDRGIGAFESVRRSMRLPDALAALQEISKGKATTRPSEHTGEGLFFVSKACRHFELRSNGLAWRVDNARSDHAIAAVPAQPGTWVRIEHPSADPTPLEQTFDAYTHDRRFDTTRCIVKLFEHGVRFVSRSEAKRLLHRLEDFDEVILDFEGVEAIGQGFADQVLRVWPGAHPSTHMVTQNANPQVQFMIDRAAP